MAGGLERRVIWRESDVLEGHIASIFRVELNQQNQAANCTVTAVGISDPTKSSQFYGTRRLRTVFKEAR
jgi:hypothetical protein